MKKRKQYLKVVEWSEEDQCFIGRVPGLALGGVHGKNDKNVYEKLCDLVDEWIEIYEEDNSPLPPASDSPRLSRTLYSVPPMEEKPNILLLAKVAGFSLHAATVCEAYQRSRLERLCRYITRPPGHQEQTFNLI